MKLKKLNISGEYAFELDQIFDVLTEKMSSGAEVTMNEIDESFREAALRCGIITVVNVANT